MNMQDFKYLDDTEQPLSWWDVLGSVGVFATVAGIVILAKMLA